MPSGHEHHPLRISLRIEDRQDQCDHNVDERNRIAKIAANGVVRLSLKGDLEFPVAATLEIDGEASSALPVDCTSPCFSLLPDLPAPSGSDHFVYHVCRSQPLAVSELVICFPSGAPATPDEADVFRVSAAAFDPTTFKVEIPCTEWNTFSSRFEMLSTFNLLPRLRTLWVTLYPGPENMSNMDVSFRHHPKTYNWTLEGYVHEMMEASFLDRAVSSCNTTRLGLVRVQALAQGQASDIYMWSLVGT